MKIIVIGSEGNVGKFLVPYLRQMGNEVFCIDREPGNRKDYWQADINFPFDIDRAFFSFKRPDIVFCLAAMVGRDTCEKSPQMAIATNIGGTENIARLCKDYQSKLVYFSTSEVYGDIQGEMDEGRLDLNPNNMYGLTKLLSENIIRYEAERGLTAFIVRPCMLYHEEETMGEHRSAMIRFAEKLVRGEKVIVHRGSSRGWLHMDDAVRAFAFVPSLTNPHIINIGNPQIKIMNYVAGYMCMLLNLDPKEYIVEIDQPIGMTLHKNPNLYKQLNLLGITPKVSLEEGIERVINRMKARIYGRKKDM